MIVWIILLKFYFSIDLPKGTVDSKGDRYKFIGKAIDDSNGYIAFRARGCNS